MRRNAAIGRMKDTKTDGKELGRFPSPRRHKMKGERKLQRKKLEWKYVRDKGRGGSHFSTTTGGKEVRDEEAKSGMRTAGKVKKGPPSNGKKEDLVRKRK